MAEGPVSGGVTSDEEGRVLTPDSQRVAGESYRNLCEHYNRGCSFVVSVVINN